MKISLIIFILPFLMFSSIKSIAIDDFHCKVPTCRDFYYGLINHRRRQQYVDVCFDTVYDLQGIPTKYGKCINQKTGKLHPPCIYALANIIKSCMDSLNELSEKQAKFFCGFTLMKYCAVHLGLGHIPQHFDDKT